MNYVNKQWYDIEPIEVMTPNGSRVVSRLFCNGIEETLHMTFSNGVSTYEIDCTFNHAFRTVDGEWVEAEYIEPHHAFDNGYHLVEYVVNTQPILTFDLNVPEESCYILESGIISHNSSLIFGGISEGINPDPAMTYTQTTAAGEIDRITPVFLELMKEKGVYNKKTIADLAKHMGSCQHVDWLTDHEKQVFRTAFEMSQETIIRMASQRGKYIDQWQSLNIFFAGNADPAYISRVHQMAFNDPRILGLYYIYSKAGVQGSSECLSCQ